MAAKRFLGNVARDSVNTLGINNFAEIAISHKNSKAVKKWQENNFWEKSPFTLWIVTGYPGVKKFC